MATTKVNSEFIAVNAISGTIIADGAITSTHLAANSVDSSELVTGSIDTIHIAANQVTAAKIVSDGVEHRHMHSNVISGLSTVTAASGDFVLLGDTSDSNNLKKALVSDLGNNLDGAVTINESGAAVDFRVEGDTEQNLLFVDGSTDRIGIGTSTPAVKLEVSDTSTNAFIKIVSDNDDFSGVYFADQQGVAGEISYDHSTNQFKIWSGADVSGSPHLLIKNTYIDAGEMTAYLQLPSGTTAQRPTAANGMMRYNETESKTEVYQGSQWNQINVSAYPYTIQYVVVAGGGAGGTGAYDDAAGGAGGGGYRSSVTGENSGRGASAESQMTANPTTVYTITVGAGGSNAVGGNSSISGSGLTTITSNGGGEGGDRQGSNNKDGGCGGGGAYLYTPAGSGTTGQGYDGGVYSGNPYHPAAAGGGAGSTASGSDNEVGGAGVATSITGSSVTYALGGHGGNTTNGASPVAGGANTGTGGGGYYGSSGNGANGGSGIVILKILTANYSGTTTGSPTVTTSGDYKIVKFTSSGTYTG